MLAFSAAPAAAGLASVNGSDSSAFGWLLATAGLGILGTVRELTQERSKLVADAKAINDLAETENRSLTDDETAKVDKLLDDADDIEKNQIPAARSAEAEIQKRSSRLAEMLKSGTAPATPPPRGADPSERGNDPVENPDSHKYSILRAVRCLLNQRPVDGYEGEISQEIAKRSGREATGFFMPHNLQVRNLSGSQRRALDTTAVAGAITTDFRASNFIDLLRNKTRVVQAGAKMITGLTGSVDIPKQTGTATTYFVGEAGAPTGSAATIGQLNITSTTQGAYTDLTRRAVNQSSMDMNSFALGDLLDAMALGTDSAVLNGSGVSNQPEGILQRSEIATIAIATDGGALTRDVILDMEEQVAVDNADDGTLNFMTNPKVRKAAKTIKLDDGSGQFLWSKDRTIEDYPALITNQVPADLTKGTGTDLSALIYGDWATIVMAYWSGMDVTIDPYSLSTSGGVRIVVLQDFQVAFRNDEALVKVVDIDTSA